MPVKKIIKKDFYSGQILEVIHKKIPIPLGAPNVCTLEVSIACIGELLLNDCNFSSVFVPERGRHMLSYLYFDSTTVKLLSKINN